MKNRNYTRWFILSAGIVLLLAGVGKLVSALGEARILDVADPLFVIPFRQLMLTVGFIELAICAICFLAKKRRLALFLVTWLSWNFLVYRTALRLIGWHQPCTCLGALTQAIGVSPRSADFLSQLLAAYLLVGSVACMLTSHRAHRRAAPLPPRTRAQTPAL